MKRRIILLSVLAAGTWLSLCSATPGERQDGRAQSTRGMAENLMRAHKPQLEYDSTFTRKAFRTWQKDMKAAMSRLMRHPAAQAAPPVMVKSVKRDGYRIERWESYPLPQSVVPFYVLIPDGVDAAHPVPAALCIPGFGQTKELLAGERQGNYELEGTPDSVVRKAAMALHYVREGLVAVAVDNPSCGELSDEGYPDYVTSSRFLLEVGWSYLGLASWQDRVILEQMKKLPYVRTDRIIASGFSLGTEPMMVLGLLDPSIYGFVYNDFMCRTRERALVMNKKDAYGARPFPNNIEHLIPEFLLYFDFPDIVAALAPRPVICTEGGMDRDFNIIAGAYKKAGAGENFEYHHYAKYANPEMRLPLDTLPSGIDRTEFFRLVNCDSPSHYLKTEWILPWLRKQLNLTN
ncbi:MAG: alpha/beta hydrolase family protein [Bacteroidaceae bacterium]|nr:alpha/beta hydrolase family protein [Bacteroidaceae bacterium]